MHHSWMYLNLEVNVSRARECDTDNWGVFIPALVSEFLNTLHYQKAVFMYAKVVQKMVL